MTVIRKMPLTGFNWVPAVAFVVSVVAFLWLQNLDISSDDFAQAKEKESFHSKSSSLPILSFNNILFVHIGKAGGESH
jgi:hypothetical protein